MINVLHTINDDDYVMLITMNVDDVSYEHIWVMVQKTMIILNIFVDEYSDEKTLSVLLDNKETMIDITEVASDKVRMHVAYLATTE